MALSGTFSYSPTIDDIVTDAFERCGVEPSSISSVQFNSAIYSLNMALVDFANNQLNLWTVEQSFLPLTTGQAVYSLPQGTIDLLEVTLRTTTRLLAGTAASSAGGTAANAFDNDFTTACTQTSANGNISYDWGSNVQNSVDMVGIRSNSATTYTLVFEGSQDGVTWETKLTVAATAYVFGETKYYSIPAATAYRYYRVRETGGATLNIQEVYFNQQVTDYLLSRLSRSEYVSFPQKNQEGRPVAYYVNRLSSPTVTFWQAPTNEFSMIYYTRITQPQDISGATQNAPVPYRFFEALTSSLAYRLAVKYAVDRVQMLKGMYDEAFLVAIREDRERVTFSITPNLSGY